MSTLWLGLVFLSATLPQEANPGELQFADLGVCELQNGQVIQDCRIGYRTWGTLDDDRSNAVLFTTWFDGTSGNLRRFAGTSGYVDTSEFFLIAVDAFGNGVSSSPSNSEQQPGAAFPSFSIRDMVEVQQRLLREHFGIDHLWAVIGISMGGMQALEWLVAYPDFVEKAVSICGSPQLTSYDLLLWESMLRVVEQCQAAGCENTGMLAGLMFELALRTPQYVNQNTSRDRVEGLYSRVERSSSTSFDAEDHASQLRAMITHDVAASFEGDLNLAAQAIKGDLLTVVISADHVVTPQAAREFATLVGGEVLELESDSGHMTFWSESELIGLSVQGFLAKGR